LRFWKTQAGTKTVFPEADGMNFSNRARADDLNDPVIVVCCVDLCTELENPLVLFEVLQHHLSFAYIIRQGFLTIYVLAGLERGRCDLRMPVVGSCAGDRFSIVPVEHVTEISIGLRLCILMQLLQRLKGAVEMIGVNIA